MSKRHANRTGDFESLFLRLEELVLANSGEDEFEEIFKLIIAKLWDERSNEESKFRVYETEAETAKAIRILLQEANRAWPGILSSIEPALLNEHLAICVQALALHKIADHEFQVMDSFFEFLVSRTAKGAKGQYFTPRQVVELCVRIMRPTSHDAILDPACGSGGFLIHAFNYVCKHERLSALELQRFSQTNVWGFDIDQRAIRVAKALMVLAGDGSANIIRVNSLLSPSMMDLFSKSCEDEPTLAIEDICRSRLRKHKGFDLILTNPPFAGEVRERQVLDDYTLGIGKPRVERDVLFLERCVRLLKPGGRLAIVLPHNKLAADSLSPLREWILQNTRVLAVVGLGRTTFLPHTHQKASVLFLRKNLANEDRNRNYRIFFAISEREGKNSKGQPVYRSNVAEHGSVWERVDHDFGEIVDRYHEFWREESLVEA